MNICRISVICVYNSNLTALALSPVQRMEAIARTEAEEAARHAVAVQRGAKTKRISKTEAVSNNSRTE